jgi:hypothetical protein
LRHLSKHPVRSLLLASAALFAAAAPARASEGGASFYLLGSGGPGAGILPPVRGIFLDNTIYYYDGSAGADRQFTLGGNVVADLDATILANFTTLLWVPSNYFLGGSLAVGGAFAVGRPDVNVGVILTGPLGNQVAVSRQDDAVIIGDPIVTASLGWVVDGVHIAASTTVNIPIGNYREGQLANLAFHRWAADFSLAATWKQPVPGFDVSAKVGITANGTNHFTDYNTGTEFHAEASLEYAVSPQFSIGAQVYHFQQMTGDSGTGAKLGPFEGRVTGVGATAAYNFQIGRTPVTARARVFTEFGVENRLEGTAAMFSLTVPLSMQLPAGAHAE